MTYSLRTGLHFCVANGSVVFLDTAIGRYFGLPDHLDKSFQGIVADRDPLVLTSEVRTLISKRIIVESAIDQPFAPVESIRPGISFGAHAEAVDTCEMLRALYSHVRTITNFRNGRYRQMMAALRTESARQKHRKCDPSDPAFAKALASFLATRRFISAQEQCLRYSLALARYLGSRGYRPNLILGVRTGPFAAHAWVQAEDIVLNDTVERVAEYTPIVAL